MEANIDKQIKDKRIEIIIQFNFIEGIIKNYISMYYFNEPEHPIISDILEDEYFNFGMLLNVFRKVLKYKNINFSINKLQKLSKIRNTVAHAQLYGKATGNSIEEIYLRYFRHGGKDKEIEEIFKQYDKLKKEIDEEIEEKLGATIKINSVPENKK